MKATPSKKSNNQTEPERNVSVATSNLSPLPRNYRRTSNLFLSAFRAPIQQAADKVIGPWQGELERNSRRKEDINQAGLPGCVSKLCSVVLVVSDLAGCSTVSWIARESPAINHESPQTEKHTRESTRLCGPQNMHHVWRQPPSLSLSFSSCLSQGPPIFTRVFDLFR